MLIYDTDLMFVLRCSLFHLLEISEKLDKEIRCIMVNKLDLLMILNIFNLENRYLKLSSLKIIIYIYITLFANFMLDN